MFSALATEWTFAHELAHVLGVVGHQDRSSSHLMTNNTTALPAWPELPVLTQDEIAAVRLSPYLQVHEVADDNR
jgi:hypothetical protein